MSDLVWTLKDSLERQQQKERKDLDDDCLQIYKTWKENEPCIVKVECYNKDEATQIKKYMQENYSEVQFFCTWMFE